MEEVPVDQPIVIQFVNRILADALSRDASGIRFGPSDASLGGALPIRYEIRGEWVDVDAVRREFSSQIINRLKMMAGLDYWRPDLVQVGSIRVSTETPPNPPISCDLTATFTKTETGDEIMITIRRID